MYRKVDWNELTPENFELPKETKLLADNRWVIMAELIPWSELARTCGGAYKPMRRAHFYAPCETDFSGAR